MLLQDILMNSFSIRAVKCPHSLFQGGEISSSTGIGDFDCGMIKQDPKTTVIDIKLDQKVLDDFFSIKNQPDEKIVAKHYSLSYSHKADGGILFLTTEINYDHQLILLRATSIFDIKDYISLKTLSEKNSDWKVYLGFINNEYITSIVISPDGKVFEIQKIQITGGAIKIIDVSGCQAKIVTDITIAVISKGSVSANLINSLNEKSFKFIQFNQIKCEGDPNPNLLNINRKTGSWGMIRHLTEAQVMILESEEKETILQAGILSIAYSIPLIIIAKSQNKVPYICLNLYMTDDNKCVVCSGLISSLEDTVLDKKDSTDHSICDLAKSHHFTGVVIQLLDKIIRGEASSLLYIYNNLYNFTCQKIEKLSSDCLCVYRGSGDYGLFNISEIFTTQ